MAARSEILDARRAAIRDSGITRLLAVNAWPG
jgi:hypothetical protein